MNVKVEVEFRDKHDFSDRNDMFDAAERFTNNDSSIHILKHENKKNCLIAEFTIENAPQNKVVDKIADEFKNILRSYTDLTINFPKNYIQVVPAVKSSKKSYTKKQGQYLSLIYYFSKLTRKAPAESDFQKFFRVSPPSVHSMILKLEGKSLISRIAGTSRSIKLSLDRSEIPDLN